MLGQIELKSPVIVAMKGHQCTGKSRVANELATGMRWFVVDVDKIRSAMADLGQHSPPPSFLTALEHLDLVSLEAACQIAQAQISIGYNIVIDSSLSRRSHLDRLLKLSDSNGYVLVVIECSPEDDFVRRRWLQGQVQASGGGASLGWYKSLTWDDLVDVENGWHNYDDRDVRKVTVDTTSLSSPSEFLELAESDKVYHIIQEKERGYSRHERLQVKDRSHDTLDHRIMLSDDPQWKEDETVTSRICNKCHEHISGSFYDCNRCNLFLHKSCAESPNRDVELLPGDDLPFLHPSRLEYCFPETHKCNGCLKDNKAFSYDCNNCLFQTHLTCNLFPTVLHHRDHRHPLYMWISSMSYFRIPCHVCGNPGETFRYICYKCDFSCHVNCAFLPPVIKHQFHRHPLNLRLSTPLEEDTYEVYCEACEKERNPKHWFYSCPDCVYTSHLTCIVPESSS